MCVLDTATGASGVFPPPLPIAKCPKLLDYCRLQPGTWRQSINESVHICNKKRPDLQQSVHICNDLLKASTSATIARKASTSATIARKASTSATIRETSISATIQKRPDLQQSVHICNKASTSATKRPDLQQFKSVHICNDLLKASRFATKSVHICNDCSKASTSATKKASTSATVKRYTTLSC